MSKSISNPYDSFKYEDLHRNETEEFQVSVLFNGIICDIPINIHETIGALKQKVLQINELYYDNCQHYFSVFLIRWSTSSPNSGVSKRLIDAAHACEVIFREENSWPGYVSIIVAPIIKLPSHITNQIADPLFSRQNEVSCDFDNNPWLVTTAGCTEWICNPGRYIQCDDSVGGVGQPANHHSINDRIFELLTNTCLKQGLLSRKVIINNVEQWKDQYFMLTPMNMWHFNSIPNNKSIDMERRIYSLPIDHTTSVNFYQGLSDKIFLESESYENPILLKSNVNEETSEYSWIDAINNRLLFKEAIPDENSSIISAETIISDYEIQLSAHEMRSLCNLDNLHGILSNQRLRGAVKAALFKDQQDELLRFWEVAEDYRMNHDDKDDEMRACRGRMIVDTYLSPASSVSSLSMISPMTMPQTFDYSDVEVFSLYQQHVASELGKICENLFFHRQSSIGRRYLQVALLPLNQSFIASTAFALTEDAQAPQASLPKKRSVTTTSTTTPTAIKNKEYNSPIMKGLFNFMKRSSSNRHVNGDHNTADEVGSGSMKPTRRISEIAAEVGFNDWLTHTSNGTFSSGKLASRAPESWWIELKDYLRSDPERYEIFTLRQPASWLPYDCRPIIDEICAKAVPLKSCASEDLLATLGFGNISCFGFVDSRYASHYTTSPANGHLTPTQSSVAISGYNNATNSPTVTHRTRTSSDHVSNIVPPQPHRSIGSIDNLSSDRALSAIYHDMPSYASSNKDAAINSSYDINHFTEYRKLFIILGEWHGKGQLFLFDPITWYLHARIHLHHISEMTINTKDASIIEILDEDENNWKLRPEIVQDRDLVDRDSGKMGLKSWLKFMSSYCSNARVIEQLVYKGQLSKRGKVNTAFKRRWFILIVDDKHQHKLRYFTNEFTGYKGEIPLRLVKSIQCQGDESNQLAGSQKNLSRNRDVLVSTRFLASPLLGGALDSSRVFQVIAVDRTWELMAASAKEAADWIRQLRQALTIEHSNAQTSNSGDTHYTIDEDDIPDTDD